MANLILTLKDSDEQRVANNIWYVMYEPYVEGFLSSNEIANVITPGITSVKSLPGYQDLKITASTETVNANTIGVLTIDYTFDTEQNAIDAKTAIYTGPNKPEEINAAQSLVVSSRRQNFVTYDWNLDIT
jgi:hypothetical protein